MRGRDVRVSCGYYLQELFTKKIACLVSPENRVTIASPEDNGNNRDPDPGSLP